MAVKLSDYLAPGEVALVLGVSERTVWRWFNEGRLPYVKAGNLRRVSRRALNGFIARNRVARKRSVRRMQCPHCGETITVH